MSMATTPATSGSPSSTQNKRALAAKRSRTRRLVVVAVLLAAIAAVAYYALGRRGPSTSNAVEAFTVSKRSFPVILSEKGELHAKESVDVKCEVEGRSTIIWLIPEGTEVKKGDLLVRLASNEIDEKVQAEQIKAQNAKAAAEAAEKELEIALDQNASDIRKADLALENAKVELNKYIEGDYEQTLMEKTLALEKAEKLLTQANDVLEDSRSLKDQGFITERELQQDELSAYEADINVKIAKRDLDIFKKYSHPKDLQQKQSDVDEAQKDLERTRKKAAAEEAKQRATCAAKQAEYELTEQKLDKLLQQQKKTEIHAPADGLVVYDTGEGRWDRRQITEGAEVYERQTIIKLPDPSRMIVKLRIHEANTSKIGIGQPATVAVEGVPGKMFSGQISKIAPLADSQNSWLNPDLKEYDTEVMLDPTDVELKPGVTARADILVGHVEDSLAVPIQAVYSVGPRSFVFRGRNTDEAEAVEVQVGTSSNEYIAVTNGLKENDVVLLAASDKLLAMLPSMTEERELMMENMNGNGARKPQAQQAGQGQRQRRPAGAQGGHRRPGGPTQGAQAGQPPAQTPQQAPQAKPEGQPAADQNTEAPRPEAPQAGEQKTDDAPKQPQPGQHHGEQSSSTS